MAGRAGRRWRARPKQDLVLVLKNPAELPVTMLWFSNGGRDYAPWSGRHRGVLGIEDGRAAVGHAASIGDNWLKREGVATAFALGEGRSVSFRHVIGAMPQSGRRTAAAAKSRRPDGQMRAGWPTARPRTCLSTAISCASASLLPPERDCASAGLKFPPNCRQDAAEHRADHPGKKGSHVRNRPSRRHHLQARRQGEALHRRHCRPAGRRQVDAVGRPA